MLTGIAITGGGDAIAQLTIERNDSMDWHRFFTLCSYGLIVTGGVNHFYYKGLDNAFGAQLNLRTALKKLVIDQCLLAPIEIAFFISYCNFWNKSSDGIAEKLKQDLKPVVINNYIVWIPAQILNFTYIPEKLRVLYTCIICMGWNSYMSWASHNKVS